MSPYLSPTAKLEAFIKASFDEDFIIAHGGIRPIIHQTLALCTFDSSPAQRTIDDASMDRIIRHVQSLEMQDYSWLLRAYRDGAFGSVPKNLNLKKAMRNLKDLKIRISTPLDVLPTEQHDSTPGAPETVEPVKIEPRPTLRVGIDDSLFYHIANYLGPIGDSARLTLTVIDDMLCLQFDTPAQNQAQRFTQRLLPDTSSLGFLDDALSEIASRAKKQQHSEEILLIISELSQELISRFSMDAQQSIGVIESMLAYTRVGFEGKTDKLSEADRYIIDQLANLPARLYCQLSKLDELFVYENDPR